VVREANALDRVCFGGFSGTMLRGVRYAPIFKGPFVGPDRRVCSSASREETRWALYGSWIHLAPWWLRWGGVRAFQVPEMAGNTRVVSPRFIELAHRAGLLVQVWTVNEEADMQRLADWGVDGLITDRPDRALRLWPATATPPAVGAGSRQSGTAAR
jgi:glycerophosphoryl diester phosphodiesterase